MLVRCSECGQVIASVLEIVLSMVNAETKVPQLCPPETQGLRRNGYLSKGIVQLWIIKILMEEQCIEVAKKKSV